MCRKYIIQRHVIPLSTLIFHSVMHNYYAHMHTHIYILLYTCYATCDEHIVLRTHNYVTHCIFEAVVYSMWSCRMGIAPSDGVTMNGSSDVFGFQEDCYYNHSKPSTYPANLVASVPRPLGQLLRPLGPTIYHVAYYSVSSVNRHLPHACYYRYYCYISHNV